MKRMIIQLSWSCPVLKSWRNTWLLCVDADTISICIAKIMMLLNNIWKLIKFFCRWIIQLLNILLKIILMLKITYVSWKILQGSKQSWFQLDVCCCVHIISGIFCLSVLCVDYLIRFLFEVKKTEKQNYKFLFLFFLPFF